MAKKTINALRREIGRIDEGVLTLCAERFRLAEEIERVKRNNGDWQRLVCPRVEEQRLRRARETGERLGLDRGFAEMVIRMLMRETLRYEVIKREITMAAGKAKRKIRTGGRR